MPTYEYRCENCGKTFERFQSISDAPLRDCPVCGGGVQRLISGGGGFLIKGSAAAGERSRAEEAAGTRCGRNQTCCGRETPCITPDCE